MKILTYYIDRIVCFEVTDAMGDGADLLVWRTDNSCLCFDNIGSVESLVYQLFVNGSLDLTGYEVRQLG